MVESEQLGDRSPSSLRSDRSEYIHDKPRFASNSFHTHTHTLMRIAYIDVAIIWDYLSSAAETQ